MLTTALVIAIIGGAALSGVATGGIQDVLRMAGISHNEIDTQAEDQQRQQSAVLAELERMVFTVSGEVAALNARIDDSTRPMSALREQYARLDIDVGNLRSQIGQMRSDQSRSYTSSVRTTASDIEAALRSARADIDSLRASIDGRDELDRKVFDAIGKRLNRLETGSPAAETTSSIKKKPTKPVRRHVARAPAPQGSWDRPQFNNDGRF